MRIVAIAADNLVLPDRMPGYTERLGADVLMTSVTQFSLDGTFSIVVLFMD